MLIRKITTHLLLYIFFILSFCFASSGFCQAVPVNNQADNNKVVATVNDKQILQQDLLREVNKDLLKYKKFGMKKANPELMTTLNKRALERIIDSEVLSQAIQKQEISDLDTQAKGEFESLKAEFPTPESFQQYLRAKQMSEEALLISLKNNLQVKAYLESQGVLHFEPAEEEIRSSYEAQKESFKTDERVKVRHILIEVGPDADESVKSAARQKAEDIRTKINSGQDFAKLAEEYSDCQMSKNRGGDLDYVKRAFMPPEFDEVAFSIENNTTSEVVATKFGYHILEVLEREPAGYLPYEKAREFIVKYIENKEVNKIRLEHVQQLRKQAKIEIFLDNKEN